MEDLIGTVFIITLAAYFIVPRWRRRRVARRLMEASGLAKALPNIVTPARDPGVFGGDVFRPPPEN